MEEQLAQLRHQTACAITLSVFGLTVRDVLQSSRFAPQARDLSVAELWSGVGAVKKAAEQEGLNTVAYDKNKAQAQGPVAMGQGPRSQVFSRASEDILTEEGFHNALGITMRLKVGGLLWMAPVCSSFLFLNLANTKRKRISGYTGDSKYPAVAEGNMMAKIAAFLFTVAWARLVEAVIENPASSLIFKYAPVRNTLQTLTVYFAVCARCRFSEEAYGKRCKKPYKFAATGDWVRNLQFSCRCPGHRHATLSTSIVKNGKRHITGILPALRRSAAYPFPLGQAIVDAWRCVPVRVPPADASGSSVPGPRSAGAAESLRLPVKGSDCVNTKAPVSAAKRRDWMTPSASGAGKRKRMTAATGQPRRAWMQLSVDDSSSPRPDATSVPAAGQKKSDWRTPDPEGH